MLTKRHAIALYVTMICSVFVAAVHVAALAGPCDPAPPSHPLPAAVDVPAVEVAPVPAPAAAEHQEPASTPIAAPAAK